MKKIAIIATLSAVALGSALYAAIPLKSAQGNYPMKCNQCNGTGWKGSLKCIACGGDGDTNN